MKVLILVDYKSHKGGVNNLQVVKVLPLMGGYHSLKVFTSTVNKAESYAKTWCKKKGHEISK